MAAGFETSDSGNIINDGVINVNGKSSIGMYARRNKTCHGKFLLPSLVL